MKKMKRSSILGLLIAKLNSPCGDHQLNVPINIPLLGIVGDTSASPTNQDNVMTSIESILLKALIVVLVSSCAEPVVLSAAPSGIAASEDQTLRPAPNASTRCAPGELLVKWKEGPDSPAATLGNAQIGSTVQRNFHEIGWQQVKLPCELSLQEGIARYRALGSVSAVEPNYAVAPILPPRSDATNPVAGVGNTGVPPSVEDGAPGSTDQLPTPHSALRTEQSAASAPTPIIPNDPTFSAQWDLKMIGMPNAWAITTGSSKVVVAMIDTGVDYNHEDLAANMSAQSRRDRS